MAVRVKLSFTDLVWNDDDDDEPSEDEDVERSFLWTDRSMVLIDPERPIDRTLARSQWASPLDDIEDEYQEMGLDVSSGVNVPVVPLKATDDQKERLSCNNRRS